MSGKAVITSLLSQGGTESDQLVCLTDLVATCAEIVDCQLPYNSAEDSYSHLDALLGTDDHRGRDQIVCQSVSGMYSIRKGNWKLIMGRGSGGWTYEGKPDEPDGQLYDLSIDIGEKNNLYMEYPEKVRQLSEMLKMYQDERRSR